MLKRINPWLSSLLSLRQYLSMGPPPHFWNDIHIARLTAFLFLCLHFFGVWLWYLGTDCDIGGPAFYNCGWIFLKIQHRGSVFFRGLVFYLGTRSSWELIPDVRSRFRFPQGSIFGSLLFLIFIADLFYLGYDLDFASYADDTTPYIGGQGFNNISVVLEPNVNKFFNWFRQNGLLANSGLFTNLLSN